MFEILLFSGSVAAFPLAHLLNGWLFSFAEITPHIALVYLPAFVRLFNVLVLGPVKGTLATFAGGFLLLLILGRGPGLIDLLGIACSVGGPLGAVYVFRFTSGRHAQIGVLSDVAVVALMYSAANALVVSLDVV